MSRRAITIVGCGPGSPDYVTPEARKAVSDADIAIGAPRLLDLFPDFQGEQIEVSGNIKEALDAVNRGFPHKRTAVLVSGDPGIFSLARLVIERFGRETCRVVPGISSVQVACARIGVDWADALILSGHKSLPTTEGCDILSRDKIAVLSGSTELPAWVADLLARPEASDYRVFVCRDLTLETESVEEVRSSEAASLATQRSVVLLIRRGALT